MNQRTDPATRTATRLAAELIIRRDELTDRQVGIIATALELPESDPLDIDHLRYLGKLKAQGVEYKPPTRSQACSVTWTAGGVADLPYTCTLPVGHQGDHQQRSSCPEEFTPGRIGDYYCSLPVGHAGNHAWAAR